MVIKIVFIYILLISSFQYKYLIGTWNLSPNKSKSIKYLPILKFNINNSVELRSYGDTIYFGKYSNNSEKINIDLFDDKIELLVIKLNSDTLILVDVNHLKDTLTYIK